MPKNQSTAAKRARAAARDGAKYTAALREAQPFRVPPGLSVVDEEALSEGELLVVDGLRALAAAGRRLPYTMADPDPEVLEAKRRAEEQGVSSLWQRWASVEAAVDGYVLRESQYGPNRSGYSSTDRGPRVPVPVLTADGSVTVVGMPEWARLEGVQWVWAHTGWPVDEPGRIVDPPQTFTPASGLRWEVAAWLDMSRDGQVLGEDYGGSASGWQTVGWCTSREDACQVAAAYAAPAHDSLFSRADVVQHGTDNGIVSVTVDTYLAVPDAPARPRRGAAAGPRPASPDRSEVPEPAWYPGEEHPPNSSLIVWTGTGWRTLMWTDFQAGHAASALGIGAGGPYEWAEDWGPRHPDRDLHDWTQEGRELHSRFPETTYAERTDLIDGWRQAKEDALLDAVAARGGFTREQAVARLLEGGEEYRQVLDVGQATIARALHTARRALPEGPERTAIRHVLDDLMDRHLLPTDAERIANEQLDTEVESTRSPATTAWCRRAVAEYVTPAPDPVAAAVEGFAP
ncbi:hypothetical protein [Streptomyces sp. NPDC047981]|uniref:hypothetical protein n=1 Tax=Streptomyces sp. NPDC047981 TaxID=3154610 RepID=UPI0034427660